MAFQFDTQAFYPELELLAEGLFTFNQLRKARQSGALAFREISKGRRVYKGAWLTAWLAGQPESKGKPADAPAERTTPAQAAEQLRRILDRRKGGGPPS